MQSGWKNNNFEHSDMVKSNLRVTNGALNEIIKETDGIMIDLTAPVVEYLNDGEDSKQDIQYQVCFHLIIFKKLFIVNQRSIQNTLFNFEIIKLM